MTWTHLLMAEASKAWAVEEEEVRATTKTMVWSLAAQSRLSQAMRV